MKVSEIQFKHGTPVLTKGDFEVTPRQARAIARSVEQAWEYDARPASYNGPHQSEYKRFEIYPLGAAGVAVIQSEVGLQDDENTMASVFCRYRRQYYVGSRGGISAYGKRTKAQKDTTKLTGYKALIYGVER